MRYQYQGTTKDKQGKVIQSATVAVFLAGTTTPAKCYTTWNGATEVYSVTSDTQGKFTFFVDAFDYGSDQTYKIIITKSGFSSYNQDNIKVEDIVLGTYIITTDKTISYDLTVPKGVIFSVNSGKTLTINGSFNAGDYQCFDGNGIVLLDRVARPHWFGALGNGSSGVVDTIAFNKAITAIGTNGGEVNCKPANYVLQALNQIVYPVSINFNNSIVYPDTTGIIFNINNTNYITQTVTIKDVSFVNSGGSTPANLIKITSGNYIQLINIRTMNINCSHSYIYSNQTVALTIDNCVFQSTTSATVPYAIYLDYVLGGGSVYTTTVDMNHIYVAGLTGVGIYSYGADFVLRGKSVVENNSGGGIYVTGPSSGITITDSYFEVNGNYDINFNNANPAEPTLATVSGCMFMVEGASSPDRIRVAAGVKLLCERNNFRDGGIVGTTAPLAYIGINNYQKAAKAGFTGTWDAELCDTIRALPNNHCNIINYQGTHGGMFATSDQTFPCINYTGSSGYNNLPSGNVATITLSTAGALIMLDMVSGATKYSGLFHASYSSSTITELADPSTAFGVTSGSVDAFIIYKSAASAVVTIKNQSGSSFNLTTNILGPLSGAALP